MAKHFAIRRPRKSPEQVAPQAPPLPPFQLPVKESPTLEEFLKEGASARRKRSESMESESNGLELLGWLAAGLGSFIVLWITGQANYYFITVPIFFFAFAAFLAWRRRKKGGYSFLEAVKAPLKVGSLAVGYLFLCFAAVVILLALVLFVIQFL